MTPIRDHNSDNAVAEIPADLQAELDDWERLGDEAWALIDQ